MYYIDFDNTLYETGKMTTDILTSFSEIIAKEKNINFDEVLYELKKSFNSTIDNFESFSTNLSVKYGIDNNIFQSNLNKIIINNGTAYTFPDAINFLKKLKQNGENICILTYVAQKKNLKQQSLKLAGSGLLQYVDEIYNTTRYKFELEIDYNNGTFIDDSPRDLEGLYNSGARKIIRIKKPNNSKRTSMKLNIPMEVPEYTSFDDINI